MGVARGAEESWGTVIGLASLGLLVLKNEACGDDDRLLRVSGDCRLPRVASGIGYRVLGESLVWVRQGVSPVGVGQRGEG